MQKIGNKMQKMYNKMQKVDSKMQKTRKNIKQYMSETSARRENHRTA
jgi:DNA anti-recombination protein RmuC